MKVILKLDNEIFFKMLTTLNYKNIGSYFNNKYYITSIILTLIKNHNQM